MKDKLLPYVKQGFQFHIKNTSGLNWFVDLQQREFNIDRIITYDIYLNDEVKFYETIEEALLNSLKYIDNKDYIKVIR